MPTTTKRAYHTYPVWGLIREAAGLSIQEKVFLHTVASHERGTSTASVRKLLAQMSMGRSTFYEVRSSLIEKGLLVESLVLGSTTHYTINKRALLSWVKQRNIEQPITGTRTRAKTRTAPVPSGNTTGSAKQHSTPASRADTGSVATPDGKQNRQQNKEDSKNRRRRRVLPPPDWSRVGLTREEAQRRGLKRVDFDNMIFVRKEKAAEQRSRRRTTAGA